MINTYSQLYEHLKPVLKLMDNQTETFTPINMFFTHLNDGSFGFETQTSEGPIQVDWVQYVVNAAFRTSVGLKHSWRTNPITRLSTNHNIADQEMFLKWALHDPLDTLVVSAIALINYLKIHDYIDLVAITNELEMADVIFVYNQPKRLTSEGDE